MRVVVLLFILLPAKTLASDRLAPESVASEVFFKQAADSAKRRCADGSLLRRCFSLNQETCVNRVNSHLDGCIRDQKIKILGQATLSNLAAAAIEREIGTCVNREYYNLGQSSYLKSTGCYALLPKGGTSAHQAEARDESRIAPYEDPLADQRPIRDRFARNWQQDVALLHTWKKDIKSRKACPEYKGKAASVCFKLALARLKISSAAQIVSLMTIGAFASQLDGESSADNILTVFELTQTGNFHLKGWQPKTEGDLYDLENLRKRETELIKIALSRAEKSIAENLARSPRAGRAPASGGMDVRSRLEFQKKRDWSI